MLVRRLDEVSAADIDAAGGKGANLGELTRARFPVPGGFRLTTEAYVLAARVARIDPRDPPAAAERLRASAMPEAISAAARKAYAALGGGLVAVRSSATAEDLPGASVAASRTRT
jgi:pyruvate,water dikinase